MFQFWMRVNWHEKIQSWKPSKDSGALRFGETREKHGQSPPYSPTQRESYLFYLLLWPSSGFSSLSAGESRAARMKQEFISSAYSLTTSANIGLLLCTRHCSGSWRFSTDQIYKAPQDIVFTAESPTPIRVPGTYQYGRNWFEQKWTICWQSPWAVHYLDQVLERVQVVGI